MNNIPNNVDFTDFNDLDFPNIVYSLSENDSRLRTLKINQDIGQQRFHQLAEALKQNRYLTELNLIHSNAGSNGATAIANALETNRNLTQLYIGGLS